MKLSTIVHFPKQTERPVHSQVYKYFKEFPLFHPNHNGFLRNHSTSTAIQQIFYFWMKEKDESKLTGSLLLSIKPIWNLEELPTW